MSSAEGTTNCTKCGKLLTEEVGGSFTAVKIKTNLIKYWFFDNNEFERFMKKTYNSENMLCLECAKPIMEAIIGE